MAVSVYPRLDALLRSRGLSVDELTRVIEEEYGQAVDAAMLQSMLGSEPLHQTDLALAGAVATALGVRLDDLFVVEAVVPPDGLPRPQNYLSPAQARRFSELQAQMDVRQLDADEDRELRQLLDEFGRSFREFHLRSAAAKRGMSFDEMVAEADRDLAERLAQIRRRENDPREQQKFAERIEQYRASMQP